MKKFLALLLSLAMVFAFAGCGGNNSETASDADVGEIEITEGVTVFEDMEWTATEAGQALQLNLTESTTINRVMINETSGGTVQKFHIEVWTGSEWENVYDNDYILTMRYCILPEDVTTIAIRLVVDELLGDATIDDIAADYLASTENSSFMNVGYASNQWYEMGWDNFQNTEEQLNSMTDLIMIGNFTFDSTGNFAITAKKGETVSYDFTTDSASGYSCMDGWVSTLKDASGNLESGKTRLWISLTALDSDAKTSSAFTDEATRTAFVAEVVEFAEHYGLYGVDIDWEYPTTSDSLEAFHQLLSSLSTELHNAGIKFSCTVAPAYSNFLGSEQYEILDYVSWMTYTNVTNTDYVQAQISYERLNDLITQTIQKGCDASKIWVGLPYFGKPADAAAATYRSLCAQYLEDYNTDTVPAGLNRITMDDVVYYYNGTYLLQDKVAYAVTTGCAGVMSWWSGQDIPVFSDNETAKVNGQTVSAENSLSRAVYDAVKRFTGVDPLA